MFADEIRRAGHTVHAPDLYDGRTFPDLETGVAYAREIGFDTIIERGVLAAGALPALIGEALNAVREAGVPALEVYPLDRDFTPSASSTGFASTFLKLGFKPVARRVPARPILRYTF